jgi:hypothetical protein
MKLGDTIYVYESCGRQERDFEHHLSKWRAYTIASETKVSWIAKLGQWSEVKIDKKTGQPRGDIRVATSHEEITKSWEDDRWTSIYKYRVMDRLRFVQDPEVVRKIAELIGYDPTVEK